MDASKKEYVFEPEQPAEFVLTDEWQDIPPGVRIPGKFDVRINLTTGRKQAKKLNVEGDASNKTSTRRNDSDLSSQTQTEQSHCKSSKNADDNLYDLNLDGNVPIPVKILDAASDILRNRSREDLCGLIPPTIILEYLDSNKPFPLSMTIPKSENGINVHLLKNKETIHYVVSCKIVSKSKTCFIIYDSLPSGNKMWTQRLKDLPKQLEMIYGDVPQLDEIEVICAQNQGYSHTKNNSGLFALANLIMLFNNQDPKRFKLKKDMRKQLKNMISSIPFALKPFNAVEVPLVDDTKFSSGSLKKKDLNKERVQNNPDEWRSPKVSLKRLEQDKNCFFHCTNRYDILSELEDLQNCNNQSSREREDKHTQKKENYQKEGKKQRKE